MGSPDRRRCRARRLAAIVLAPCVAASGCKSDLSQQLLERELRYQEDQIYSLQDELQDSCSRAEMLVSENASLRRQLGIAPGDPLGRPRGGPTRLPTPPVAVPPALEIPEAVRPPAPAAVPPAPPALDNVPPLPVTPSASSEPTPLSLPEPADGATTSRPPVAVPVSYGEPDARPVRLAVTAATTACFDDDGDGRSDGVAVTVEPRDASERLVQAPGHLEISVFDAAEPAAPLASRSLAPAEAAAAFRPTTRLRGLHVPVRWTGAEPGGDHVRVVVRVTGPEGAVLQTDALVPARDAAAGGPQPRGLRAPDPPGS